MLFFQTANPSYLTRQFSQDLGPGSGGLELGFSKSLGAAPAAATADSAASADPQVHWKKNTTSHPVYLLSTVLIMVQGVW